MGREKPENVELFIDCLEAMVETCLQPDNDAASTASGSFVHSGDANTSGNPLITTASSSNTASNQTIFPMPGGSNTSGGIVTTSGKSPQATHHSYFSSASNFAASASMSSQTNLITGSLSSSISMGSIHSPCDRDMFEMGGGELPSGNGAVLHHRSMANVRNSSLRRNSSPKHMF
jgi:hypothetical protein